MGAYHTSLDVGGYSYTFAAGGGIVRTKFVDPTTTSDVIGAGETAVFHSSVVLGETELTGSEVTAVVARLRSKFGRDGHYHLLNRNCNHFTQTFATALLLQGCSKMKGGVYVLKTYPTWVNRAANVGTHAIDHGNVCSVWEEALEASGQQGKVGWEFDDVRAGKGDVGKVSGEAKSKKAKKKELTEKQRRALEKIKGGKK